MSKYIQEHEEVLSSADGVKPGDIIKMVPGKTNTNHDYDGCLVKVVQVKDGIINGDTIRGYMKGSGNWWSIGVDHWRFIRMTEWDD